jgi:D-alanyl-D-alanine dipeptidase
MPIDNSKPARMLAKSICGFAFLFLVVGYFRPAPSGVGNVPQVAKPKDVSAQWKGLIGEYASNGDTICVLEENGRLTLLMKRLDRRIPLQELSGNVFNVEERTTLPDTTIVFKREGSGRAASFVAGRATFKRLAITAEDGSIFRIKPLKPIGLLRREALRARPPEESGSFLKADLVDVTTLDSTIKLDIRYATKNNFMGEVLYSKAKAFLQRSAAEALVRADRWLEQQGYGLLIHDAYRPWYVTKMFWDATPEDEKTFVANPSIGSRHNRGCAVDVSLYDLNTGRPVDMVSGYDEFSHRASPDYPGGTSLQRWDRELLRRAMEQEGFNVYEWEWWHFDYKDWREYPIGNRAFEEIR